MGIRVTIERINSNTVAIKTEQVLHLLRFLVKRTNSYKYMAQIRIECPSIWKRQLTTGIPVFIAYPPLQAFAGLHREDGIPRVPTPGIFSSSAHKRETLASQSEVSNTGRFHLQLKLVRNQGDEFGIRSLVDNKLILW